MKGGKLQILHECWDSTLKKMQQGKNKNKNKKFVGDVMTFAALNPGYKDAILKQYLT